MKTKKKTKTKRLTKAELIESEAMATAPDCVEIQDKSECSGVSVRPWYARFYGKGKTGARRISLDAWFHDGFDSEAVGVELDNPAKIRELAAALLDAAEWLENNK